MTGFLDGINESLKGYENPIDTMEEDTEVKIEIDPEKLYYNMVEAKATWLYELPQWDRILSLREEKGAVQEAEGFRNRAARERRSSRTIRVRAEAERSTKSAAVRTHKMKRKPVSRSVFGTYPAFVSLHRKDSEGGFKRGGIYRFCVRVRSVHG